MAGLRAKFNALTTAVVVLMAAGLVLLLAMPNEKSAVVAGASRATPPIHPPATHLGEERRFELIERHEPVSGLGVSGQNQQTGDDM